MNARRFAEAVVLLLINAVVWAQTTSLPLTDDTHIANDAGDWLQADRNYGSRPLMLVHDWGPFYALIRFDAAAISGQTVDSATLRLYLAELRQGGSISVHAITSPWTESSVTWNTRPSFQSAAEAVIEIGSADVGSVVSVDITHLVAQWASGAVQNHGVLLRTTEPIRAVFDTKETVGGVPAELEVMASTGPSVYAKVLDFTDPDNCVIDEPGYYILNRSWNFSDLMSDGACLDTGPRSRGGIYITADEVTLDLRGFSLELYRPEGSDRGDATLHVGTSKVTLRDGTVAGNAAVFGEANSIVIIERMTLLGDSNVGAGSILYSQIYSTFDRGGVDFEGCSIDFDCPAIVVKNSFFTCTVPRAFCLDLAGHHYAEITGNTFTGRNGIRLYGGGAVVADNIIRVSMTHEDDSGIWAWMDTKIIARNIISNDSGIGKGITVTGHQGIVEGNIIRGPFTGILFIGGADNFAGNNRVSAVTPYFNLESQIDWGGNVSY